MSRIGTNELLLIFAVALIVFGPSRLPMLGKMAGKTLGQLKGYVDKMTNEFDVEENESNSEEYKKKEEDTVADQPKQV